MADVRIVPGTVTQESPLLVQIDGEDETGQRCQKLATARLGDVGGVLKVGTQRLWIGAYDRADEVRGLDDKVREVVEVQQGQQEALNVTSSGVDEVGVRVDAAQGAAEQAAIDAAAAFSMAEDAGQDATAAMGIAQSGSAVLTGTSATGPETRRDGQALRTGDMYARMDTSQPPRLIGLQWYTEGVGWDTHRMVAGSLLVPSSIGSVLIGNGAITAPKIHTEALDFKEATGMILTSAEIISPDIKTATSGARVEITTAGLRAYNSSNALTSSISGASGSFTGGTFTGGTIRTAATGTRIELSGSTLRSYTGTTERIRLTTDALNFYAPTGAYVGRVQGDLVAGTYARLVMSGSAIQIGLGSNDVNIGDLTAASNLYVRMGNIAHFAATEFQFEPRLPSHGDNRWVMRENTAGGKTRMTLAFPYGAGEMLQTTLSPNLHMAASGGVIYHTTSARRYKADIRDVASPERVLNVPVRDWIDATRLHDDPDYDERTPGVIAEELEDAGLSEFVTYAADGQTSGVMYDRLPLLLIPLVRDLRDRIDHLEALHA